MLTLAVSSNLRCELHWNVLVACFQWRQTCISSGSFQMKSRLSAPLHEKLTRVEKLQSVCVTWSRMRRYFSCTVLFSFTVTWPFLFFFVPFTGTFISAFTVLCGARSELISERGKCCVFWLNVAAALIQILTAVIMVGWIMSIFWGMDMVILASQCACLALFAFSVSGLSVLFASPPLFISLLPPFGLSVSHMTYMTVCFWAPTRKSH